MDIRAWGCVVNDGGILVVSGVSVLALAVVHSITFVIGRRLGRYNVVDVAWGQGFVAVATVAAVFGHGDAGRPMAAASTGVDLGAAAELAHLPQDGRQRRGCALCQPAARRHGGSGGPQGLSPAGLLDAIRLIPTTAVGGEWADIEAVTGRHRAGIGGVA